MKSRLLTCIVFVLVWLTASYSMTQAQSTPMTSAQLIDSTLSNSDHRNELSRLDTLITQVLADQGLTHQATRQMLAESKTVITEMLSAKVGANIAKLVELAKWMKSQSTEKQSVEDSGNAPAPDQQFILDNPLAGQEVYLTTIIREVLIAYLKTDRENAGNDKLESLIQLYLNFPDILESKWVIADDIVLYAPNWIQPRFLQLTGDQKRQVLKDIQFGISEKARPLAADEEAAPSPTPQEQAAYEAAFQYIEANTPNE